MKKYIYVQPERDDKGRMVAKGNLKKGMKIGADVHKEFLMHEINTGDLLDAEQDAGTDKPLTFNGAVLVRQLDRIGSFDGPFTFNMLRALSAHDFAILRGAQAELSDAGEVEQ